MERIRDNQRDDFKRKTLNASKDLISVVEEESAPSCVVHLTVKQTGPTENADNIPSRKSSYSSRKSSLRRQDCIEIHEGTQ